MGVATCHGRTRHQHSTQLNSTQLNSIQLNSTQLNSKTQLTQLNSTQLNVCLFVQGQQFGSLCLQLYSTIFWWAGGPVRMARLISRITYYVYYGA